MEFNLHWRGPIGPGKFPATDDEVAALAVPGVYLRIKRYRGDRTVSYVGQSTQLIARFDQHLRDLLTFSSVLRDGEGAIVLTRNGISRYQAYNKLDEVLRLVTAETRRLIFFWVAAEDGFEEAYLTLIESALKDRLESKVALSMGLVCENIQGFSEAIVDEEIIIHQDFSVLDPEDAALVSRLVGSDPIRVAVPISEISLV